MTLSYTQALAELTYSQTSTTMSATAHIVAPHPLNAPSWASLHLHRKGSKWTPKPLPFRSVGDFLYPACNSENTGPMGAILILPLAPHP